MITVCNGLQGLNSCAEAKGSQKYNTEHCSNYTSSFPPKGTLKMTPKMSKRTNKSWHYEIWHVQNHEFVISLVKITFISSSFELLCESARDTLDMNRLMKLYKVCQATTNNVTLWVKWSRTSSAISKSNVKKQTNCSFMKKYILVLVLSIVPMCNLSRFNNQTNF